MTHPLIKSITPRGLLSFGPDTPPLELGMLNVLIGPNASGKSNLLDVLGLVRSIPSGMHEAVRGGGGTECWLWGSDHTQEPELDLVVNSGNLELRHRIVLRSGLFGLQPVLEQIHNLPDTPLYESRFDSRQATIRVRTRDDDGRDSHPGELVNFGYPDQVGQSILSQVMSIFDYPEMTILASEYRSIRMYSTWHFGRDAMLRRPQAADSQGYWLEEDYTNLGMVLSQMGTSPEAKLSIIEGLQELYEGFTSYEAVVNSGSVQIYFTEGRRHSIPATRLSDGTLRYLCLLAMLYNPHPPRVICIEEPELGLHPDIVAGLAKHLRAASGRMQVIVTTHSDILIDALSDTPESIIVFENHDGATRMERLKRDDLSIWLENYRLGELWTSGQIGGNRW